MSTTKIPAGYNESSMYATERFDHSSTVPVTLELAKHYANMKVVYDRKMQAKRLRMIKRSIDNNSVTPWHWADCFCYDDDTTYRLNGKHSTHLMVTGQIPAAGIAIIEHYIVKTRDEVLKLWGTFDPAESSRTKVEVLESRRDVDDDLAKVPITLLKAVETALGIAHEGHSYTSEVSHSLLADLLLKNKPFAIWCNEVFPATNQFCRAGIMYAAFVTYNVDKAKAVDFWKEVITMVGLKQGSPALALHHRIYSPGQSTGKEKSSRQWHDLTNLCLRAWQAWLDEEKLTQILLTPKTSGMRGLERFITQTKIGKIVKFCPSARIYKD